MSKQTHLELLKLICEELEKIRKMLSKQKAG